MTETFLGHDQIGGTGGTPLSTAAQGLTAKPLSPSLLAWRRFRRHRLAMASAVILVLLTIIVFFPALLTEYDPNARIPEADRLESPSAEHWFGTNGIRQDHMSRVLHGGQISLQIGLAVALVSAVIGSIVGAVAGFFGGALDNFLMRTTDLFLAIPGLVSLILITKMPEYQDWAVSLFGAKGTVRSIITALALFFWMPMARIVRGMVLSLKEKEFVEAARAVGSSNGRILFRHLLPNCTGQIIVNITLSVAAAILTESALSFLGFGVQSATVPTWGNLLEQGRGQLGTEPHLVWFPGLAIMIVVLCVNYLGDGLRDAFDPRQAKK